MARSEWCRSCGRPAAGPGRCEHCGTPLDAPGDGDPRVGTVVQVGRAMMTRPGIVLAVRGDRCDVLSKDAAPAALDVAGLDRLPPVPIDGPPVRSGPGRILRAVRAAGNRALKTRWDVAAVRAAAWERAAEGGTALRRAVALDALALGLRTSLGELGLSTGEIAWYEARDATGRDDASGALHWLERLPTDAYPVRVELLLRLAPRLFSEPAAADRARRLLEPFRDAPAARALHAALTGRPGPDATAALAAVAAALPPPGRALATAVTAGDRPPAVPRGLPALAALDGYLAARDAGDRADVEVLAPLPVPLLDELADLGVLTTGPSGPGWDPATAGYLRCRVDPGGAAEDDLARTGFTAERARRRYLAADERGLAALPAGDPGVAHYGALLRSRLRETPVDPHLLRPAARDLLTEIREIRERTARGEPSDVSHALAADASCRPLLHDSAVRGLLRAPGGVGPRSSFGLWLDLCGLQRRVFDERWDDVVTDGLAFAERAGRGPARREARSMVALARSATGDPGGALHDLEAAIDEEPSPGLLVNAAVIAGRTDFARAVRFLGHMHAIEEDEATRQAVIGRATGLWSWTERAGQECPDELRALVLQRLRTTGDRRHYITLLGFLAMRASAWFADRRGTLPDEHEWQRDVTAYYRARAGTFCDPPRNGFEDVAAALVKRPHGPGERHFWFADELAWFVDVVNDAVHVELGTAAHLWPAIDVLLRADVLSVRDRLVLGVRGAAHLSVRDAKQDRLPPAEREERLLLAPVADYCGRRDRLTKRTRAEMDADLGPCLLGVGLTRARVMYDVWDRYVEQWNGFVREHKTNPNPLDVYRRQFDLVKKTTELVDHLYALDGAIRRFPEVEGSTQLWREFMAKSVQEWRNEMERVKW
ncbi:hypothetical protein [Actinomadura algeriensis]|uniref:Uncharacterized protein n=1 Tax=Actinomadura algeriensis TaxID=1679523 RepID=A0ABR9K3W2_9ACTN|nr:hypothetical protein [Actinomadura algeriensis]MBE1537045.1 hypothetical protein [Actinomadura algeriensis]